MKIQCAEAIVKCLEHHGVDTVFGYPGGAVLDLYQAIRTSNVKHVLTRTEQGAAHAASGYARRTGRAGVCIATSGPGATNLVTGIATAYMDSIPMVAITGQVATNMVGTDAFQEVDIYGITKPIVKHNYLVTRAEDVPQIIAEAFYLAETGRPGPVLIDIPKDIAAQMCDVEIDVEPNLPGYIPVAKPIEADIKAARELIKSAEKPLIYAGGGIIHSGASDELLKLAYHIDSPVAVTLMGKDAFPHNNPLYVGFIGLHGWPSANIALANCDVLIAIGVRFDDRVICNPATFASQAKIIHIDIDAAEINKNVDVDIALVGDAKDIITDLLECLPGADCSEWVDEVKYSNSLKETVYHGMPDAKLTARMVLDTMSKVTNGEAVVVTDVGQHQMLTAQFYMPKNPRTFISSGGLGTMGYGMPAALGAALADKDALTILVTGDGSFQMTLNELATAREQGAKIKVLLLNNGNLGMVRQLQKHYSNENYFAIDMPGNPDFIKLAEAYGMKTYKITEPNQVEETLKEAFANDELTLIECIIDPLEMVYPMVLGGDSIEDMTVGSNV